VPRSRTVWTMLLARDLEGGGGTECCNARLGSGQQLAVKRLK
jgi:hypothetical protein